MKIFIFLIIFYICHSFGNNNLKNFQEKFLNFTEDKVKYDYDEQNILTCVAQREIFSKEFIFKIPEEHVICLFDIFPFKYELGQIITEIMKQFRRPILESKEAGMLYLMSLYLMYLDYPNKDIIELELLATNLNHYIIKPNEQNIKWIEELKKSNILNNFDDNDYKLMHYLGLRENDGNEVKWIHQILMENVKTLKNHRV
jgi:hypothetical protein